MPNYAIFFNMIVDNLVIFNRFAAPDTVIANAQGSHLLRVVEISAIENDRILESWADQLEIRGPEMLPFGANDQGVSAFQGVISWVY